MPFPYKMRIVADRLIRGAVKFPIDLLINLVRWLIPCNIFFLVKCFLLVIKLPIQVFESLAKGLLSLFKIKADPSFLSAPLNCFYEKLSWWPWRWVDLHHEVLMKSIVLPSTYFNYEIDEIDEREITIVVLKSILGLKPPAKVDLPQMPEGHFFVKTAFGHLIETVEIEPNSSQKNKVGTKNRQYQIEFLGNTAEIGYRNENGNENTTLVICNYPGVRHSTGTVRDQYDFLMIVAAQVDRLLAKGVSPENIRLRGFSIGGFCVNLGLFYLQYRSKFNIRVGILHSFDLAAKHVIGNSWGYLGTILRNIFLVPYLWINGLDWNAAQSFQRIPPLLRICASNGKNDRLMRDCDLLDAIKESDKDYYRFVRIRILEIENQISDLNESKWTQGFARIDNKIKSPEKKSVAISGASGSDSNLNELCERISLCKENLETYEKIHEEAEEYYRNKTDKNLDRYRKKIALWVERGRETCSKFLDLLIRGDKDGWIKEKSKLFCNVCSKIHSYYTKQKSDLEQKNSDFEGKINVFEDELKDKKNFQKNLPQLTKDNESEEVLLSKELKKLKHQKVELCKKADGIDKKIKNLEKELSRSHSKNKNSNPELNIKTWKEEKEKLKKEENEVDNCIKKSEERKKQLVKNKKNAELLKKDCITQIAHYKKEITDLNNERSKNQNKLDEIKSKLEETSRINLRIGKQKELTTKQTTQLESPENVLFGDLQALHRFYKTKQNPRSESGGHCDVADNLSKLQDHFEFTHDKSYEKVLKKYGLFDFFVLDEKQRDKSKAIKQLLKKGMRLTEAEKIVDHGQKQEQFFPRNFSPRC